MHWKNEFKTEWLDYKKCCFIGNKTEDKIDTDLHYDGTFEGFLTAIFECYNRKDFPVEIVSRDGEQKYLFAQKVDVQTDEPMAERV